MCAALFAGRAAGIIPYGAANGIARRPKAAKQPDLRLLYHKAAPDDTAPNVPVRRTAAIFGGTLLHIRGGRDIITAVKV